MQINFLDKSMDKWDVINHVRTTRVALIFPWNIYELLWGGVEKPAWFPRRLHNMEGIPLKGELQTPARKRNHAGFASQLYQIRAGPAY
jgi:hypothetical protein